jgi:peptidoglycan/LPS O-acetylase OafA/YrhL
VLRWVGTVSYGLFLWHTLIVSAAAWLLGDDWWTNPYRLLAFTLAGGLAAAALSWYLVEKPAMRLSDRLLGRLATPRRPVPVRPHVDAPALSTADSGEASR